MKNLLLPVLLSFALPIASYSSTMPGKSSFKPKNITSKVFSVKAPQNDYLEILEFAPDSLKTGKQSRPYSDAVALGNTLYISGQLGIDPASNKFPLGGFDAEATQAMENLAVILKHNDLKFDDLVSVTIYLTSMKNYEVVNKIYSGYFRNRFPARVCIAVAELPRNARIEIAAIAGTKN
ncbi:Rid family detoxifying hydrolase [Mucilaginibacter sp. cycad4]|uniref:Rid family detoxifying hydrolase n=1 Tax=Mucilaginibacter sp. cycad4 TaxID=3342096 RepID=UPI002AAB3DBD|nr:Rid family detoxifying hydrolase [Mucilaginibacter gossypii]WPU99176.1 Rid family detoxifying hydrolase [Mucilaginibacter gossypii]